MEQLLPGIDHAPRWKIGAFLLKTYLGIEVGTVGLLGIFRFFHRETVPKLSPTLESRFSEVFKNNIWGDDETFSGPGSRRDSLSVSVAIEALHKAISDQRIRSISDIPCGDFNWMPELLSGYPSVRYHGFDIVQAIVTRNSDRHPSFKFEVLDVTSDEPPKADLVFCKDLVNHLTYRDVLRLLRNVKRSKSKYLLMSNNFGHENSELDSNEGGHSRFLDVVAAPLSLPAPAWQHDYFGLWKLADISHADIDAAETRIPRTSAYP